MDGEDEKSNPDARWIRVLAVGVAAIALFSWQATDWPASRSMAAVAAMLSGAALFAGGLVGFLFGIPRRVQRSPEAEGADGSLYGANTNLEQISDWLTKILVGVGLTQIGEIGGALEALGSWAGRGLGGGDRGSAFAVGLVVYFTIAGFLIAYLWTRIRLSQELTEAEDERRRLNDLEQQTQADITALALVARQLSGEEAGRAAQDALSKAVKAASGETRAHIFYRAQVMRWRNWRDPGTKGVMERTIPVFRALIDSDTAGQYHANHGQLGFALKDQRQPDLAGAREALSRAIDIRGDAGQSEWRSYELNRALCLILQDPEFRADRRSSAETRERILADLKVAREDEQVWSWCGDLPAVRGWMKLNGVGL